MTQTALAGALVFVLLQGNTLYLNKIPSWAKRKDKAQQEISRYPVFRAEKSEPLQGETVLAFGREPQGPHLWVLTGDGDIVFGQQQKGSAHIELSYRLKLRLYITRVAGFARWQRFREVTEPIPHWTKWQKQYQKRHNKAKGASSLKGAQSFLYQVPKIRGQITLPTSQLRDRSYWQELLQRFLDKGEPFVLPMAQLADADRHKIHGRLMERLQQQVSAHWHSGGVLLWFKGQNFGSQGLHIFLGDYSFRKISGYLLDVPDSYARAPEIYFLRKKNKKILLSTISCKKDHDNPRDLDFALGPDAQKKLLQQARKNSQDASKGNRPLQPNQIAIKRMDNGHFFIKILQRQWLVNGKGKIVWDSAGASHQLWQSKKDWDIPKGKGALYLTSEDKFPLSPKSENLVFFKIYIDKYELGRTSPTIGSRTKEYTAYLKPGKHLLRVVRWELSGEEYRKSRKILQPESKYITIVPGKPLWVDLSYQSGQKPTLSVKGTPP